MSPRLSLDPYTFKDFIDDLEMITEVEKSEVEKIRKISRKMKLLLATGSFLTEAEKQGFADRYARHLVHVDRQRRFIVVSLVWGPGHGTPIHDHQTWGVAGVVEGDLHVANYYRLDDGRNPGYAELREVGSILAPPGTVTYVLPPNEEIHRMENPTDKVTISLHVYGKEIFECNMFDMEARTCKKWQLAYQNLSKIER